MCFEVGRQAASESVCVVNQAVCLSIMFYILPLLLTISLVESYYAIAVIIAAWAGVVISIVCFIVLVHLLLVVIMCIFFVTLVYHICVLKSAVRRLLDRRRENVLLYAYYV